MIVLVAFERGYLDPLPMRPGHNKAGLPPLEICPVEIVDYDFDGPLGQWTLNLWAHHVLIVLEVWLDYLGQAVLGVCSLRSCLFSADLISDFVSLQIQDLVLQLE